MVYSLSITTFHSHFERRIPCRNFILNQLNLARNLLSQSCAKLFVFIRNTIFSDDFKSRYRLFSEDFTRDRKLPFHNLILLMLNLMRGSYQDELDHFFKALQRTDQQYPHDVFADLYHLRWPVEEDYKILKCRLEVENFAGKSVHSIYQDFHAKVLMKNLTAVLTGPVNDELARTPAIRQYRQNFRAGIIRIREDFRVAPRRLDKGGIEG